MRQITFRLTEGDYQYPHGERVNRPGQVFDLFKSLGDQPSETVLVVYLFANLTGFYDVHATGSAACVGISVQDLFARAYLTRSRYMIVVHNHPQGDPAPSPSDLEVLKLIQAYAVPLPTIDLLDFVIISDGAYWSHFEDQDGGEYELGPIRSGHLSQPDFPWCM